MVTGKRELIDTGTDKRHVRRDEKGRFDKVVDVGRSLSQDRKRQAEHESKPGTAIEGTGNASERRLAQLGHRGSCFHAAPAAGPCGRFYRTIAKAHLA